MSGGLAICKVNAIERTMRSVRSEGKYIY
jgi:hypothetical protein